MARKFAGGTDEIQCGGSTLSALIGDHIKACSIAVWVKAAALTNAYSGIIGWNDGSLKAFQILQKSTGKFAYYIGDGTNPSIGVDPGTNTIGIGVWCHVGLAFSNAGNTLRCYFNGTSDGTVTPNRNLGNAGIFRLGNDAFANRHFNGSLAHAAIWGAELITPEFNLLTRGIPPYLVRPQSLIGYWPLDGYGHPALDLATRRNNGVLTGTTFTPDSTVINKSRIRNFNVQADVVQSFPVLTQPPYFPGQGTHFRRTFSPVGTRAGARQRIAG